MQNPTAVASLPWWAQLLIAVATGLLGGGGIVAIFQAYFTKRKLPLELDESRARALKTSTETRTIELTANATAGETVIHMMQALTNAQTTITQLIDQQRVHEDQLDECKRLAEDLAASEETRKDQGKRIVRLNARYDNDIAEAWTRIEHYEGIIHGYEDQLKIARTQFPSRPNSGQSQP